MGALRAGKLVSFPTETVYGLGANGLDGDAVLQIFKAKGRPLNDPCILHVPSAEEGARLFDFSTLERSVFDVLTEFCWPGPLSIVGRASSSVPRVVTAQTDFVAVRCPRHPVALDLLREAKVPVAAPSANRFGHISPTRPEHVAADLGHWPGLQIVDGGPCGVGIESTVAKLDLENHRILVLRKGGATKSQLEAALAEGAKRGAFNGSLISVQYHQRAPSTSHAEEDTQAQAAPGMMLRHYAPSIPTFLLGVDESSDSMSDGGKDTVYDPSSCVMIDFGKKFFACRQLFSRYFELCGEEGLSGEEEACRRVFELLRVAEESAPKFGIKLILLTDFSADAAEGGLAAALHDRLFRAASGGRMVLRLDLKGKATMTSVMDAE